MCQRFGDVSMRDRTLFTFSTPKMTHSVPLQRFLSSCVLCVYVCSYVCSPSIILLSPPLSSSFSPSPNPPRDGVGLLFISTKPNHAKPRTLHLVAFLRVHVGRSNIEHTLPTGGWVYASPLLAGWFSVRAQHPRWHGWFPVNNNKVRDTVCLHIFQSNFNRRSVRTAPDHRHNSPSLPLSLLLSLSVSVSRSGIGLLNLLQKGESILQYPWSV